MHVLEPLIRACGDGCSEQVAASLHDGMALCGRAREQVERSTAP
jgi:hypothetical protein